MREAVCQKIGKSLSIYGLITTEKNVNNRVDTLSVTHYFRQADYSFNQDAKFTLEDHQDSWILCLKTPKPYRLNDKLNHPRNTNG